MEVNELRKELKRLEGKLARRNIYPASHRSEPNGTYVTIRCVSEYYNGSQKWFINRPKTTQDWADVERHAMLRHALECPDPTNCPTVHAVFATRRTGERP